MIQLEALSKSYEGNKVLSDITCALPKGGVTAIIGPNGAGKSTLLSIIARMLKADQGKVTLDTLDMATAPGPEIAKRLAVLRQDNHTSARLTVRELVSFGRYPHSKGRMTGEDVSYVTNALTYLGLRDLENRFLDELSGGQRQRAYIAMVIAQNTDHILLDEPLNNLDIRHAVGIMRLIHNAARDLGKTILVVLHDINIAAAWCDRIMVMKNGCLAHLGTPDEIMTANLLTSIYETEITVHELAGRKVAVY